MYIDVQNPLVFLEKMSNTNGGASTSTIWLFNITMENHHF